MAALGGGLILIGVIISLVGMGGFVDTRKVDRRYRTGYKNNEPDDRNLGRSARRILYGVGIVIVGAAVNSLSEPKMDSSTAVAVESVSVPLDAAGGGASPDTLEASKGITVPTERSTDQEPTTTMRFANTPNAGSSTVLSSGGKATALGAGGSSPRAAYTDGRLYSESEIAQMEDERQYHGNDPLVRRRLGLPSRETGMLMP